MTGTGNLQRLNTRLASARPSATYAIIDRVAQRRAEGAKIISLCAGEPDFDTPAPIREAARQAIPATRRSPAAVPCAKRWRRNFVRRTACR